MRVNSKFEISDFRFQIGAVVAVAIAIATAVLHAQKIDTKAAAAAIMQADRDFNQSVTSRDKKKFLSLISEIAVFVGDGPMRGHDEILKGWSPFFDPNGPTLTWEPTSAEVLVGGDVGITIGSWTRRTKAADGKTSEARGQYVTTWQAEGRRLERGLRHRIDGAMTFLGGPWRVLGTDAVGCWD